jgi:endonuclease-3
MEDRVRAVHAALEERYGAPEPRDFDPLAHLVRTILSQNTTDENRDEAYRGLVDRFGDPDDGEGLEAIPDGEAVEAADPDEVAGAIRPAGLANQKARRIQATLEAVRTADGDGYGTGFVEEMDADEALDWMTSIKGIGPKTASVVLLFDFEKPLFPVDTHCHRVGKRFGLLPDDTSRPQAHDVLRERVPEDLMYPLHLLLIRHGREVCSARNPGCADDPICQRFCENAGD